MIIILKLSKQLMTPWKTKQNRKTFHVKLHGSAMSKICVHKNISTEFLPNKLQCNYNEIIM